MARIDPCCLNNRHSVQQYSFWESTLPEQDLLFLAGLAERGGGTLCLTLTPFTHKKK